MSSITEGIRLDDIRKNTGNEIRAVKLDEYGGADRRGEAVRPARAASQARLWLDLFACFLIPAYTLLFAGGVEWLGTNFSVIAVTGKDHYWGFVYWGALAGDILRSCLQSWP